ncbi:MAG TPA: Zn-dependent hydrolase [Candidatus Tectomicrobia bacterium]|nr:Zn-dependent hydrolase [Candidatus Tectomicrobia bacterium]
MPQLAINIDRVWRDIDVLASFSAGGEGVNRLTFSDEDRAARAYLRDQMTSAGLEVTEFPPGVMLGRLDPTGSGEPAVMSGSHIDAVPAAGRFDGIVGVVGALEVGRVLAEQRLALRHPYEVVVYPEEEGTRFGAVLTGSKAWVGELSPQQLASLHDCHGISYLAAMEAYGLQAADLERQRFKPGQAKALLELHIEQSVVLEECGVQIGVVTTITGIRGFEVTLKGVANHAGATPMGRRRDALAGAAEIMVALERLAPTLGAHTVCTVGQLACSPGARNVIPGEVRFSVDFRDIEGLDAKWEQVEPRIRAIASARQLAMEIRPLSSSEPVALSSTIQDILEQVCSRRGLSCMRMPSGAVHDAQVMARLVNTGMIFIPSRGGRSHCPEEYTEPSQVEQGVNVLLDAVVALAG